MALPSEVTRSKQGSSGLHSTVRGSKSILAALMREGLDPRRAFAAVFIGVFIGVVPIYGFQSLVAIGLAALFRLNKPLTFAATFVNNPALQPLLVLSSVELGYFALHGEFLSVGSISLTASDLRSQLFAWFVGSVILGLLLGGSSAMMAYLLLKLDILGGLHRRRKRREWAGFVRSLYARCPSSVRGFVGWKLRLDRLFDYLAEEDLGGGPAVDLGCGYGMALALSAFRNSHRRLIGCDLDRRRVQAAEQALGSLEAELSVGDVRSFKVPPAGLIMIFDVLQYLDGSEQVALLRRCCDALEPGGRLIFRVHDTERGVASKLSEALDRAVFKLSGNALPPTILRHSEYIQALEDAGMEVKYRRFVNRLPLAHILFTAQRPGQGQNSEQL
jgi:uncharacterized protein (DUF2062 family)/2-polyprenyl-3-methyl-5-hydroxy-6-metoxy-1,4-benzoquinol methylase